MGDYLVRGTHFRKDFRKSSAVRPAKGEENMKLFTERTAATLLSLSYGYLKALRLNNEINYIPIGKRAVRYTEQNLEDFIQSRKR